MTSTALKLIALVLMFIDHIGALLPGMPLWLRWIGRLSACTFFFCAVEGFTHTRDKKRYIGRLYLMNLGMTAMNLLLPFLLGRSEMITMNVFLEITGMMVLLYLLDLHEGKPLRQLGIGVLFFVCQFGLDALLNSLLKYEDPASEQVVRSLLVCIADDSGALLVDVLILLFWLCRGSKRKLAIAYSGYCLLYLFLFVLAVPGVLQLPVLGDMFPAMGTVWDRLFRTEFQWMMLLALPLLLSYNGQKGKGLKWLFYVFYPAHIAVLYTIGVFLR